MQSSVGCKEFVNINIYVFVCVLSKVLLADAAIIRWYPLFTSGSDVFVSTQMESLCRCFTGLAANAIQSQLGSTLVLDSP